jgi:3-phosphoshikimate 1-carboxyvinyltransferase
MSKIIISKSTLSGNLTVPPSKSIFQRACAAAVLKQGATVIKNGGYSDDDKAAIEVIKTLGAQTVFVGTSAIIKYENKEQKYSETFHLDCKDSGLSSRMFMPIVASLYYSSVITGSDALKKRPFTTMIDTLLQLGLDIYTSDYSLPIRIEGNLLPQDITLDGSVSSQFLTGILLAYSSFSLSSPVTVTVSNLVSKPYIDLTLDVIGAFGLNVPTNESYEKFTFLPKQLTLGSQVKFEVEGDWSSASTLLVAGAIAGSIEIDGINTFSNQGDKSVLSAFMDAGAILSIEAEKIRITNTDMKAFHFNALDTPDLFPVLAVLASQCEGTSAIEGVHRLIHKESNRALAIVEILNQIGVETVIQDDLLLVTGKASIKGGVTLSSQNDHRIAMMICLLGLVADEPIVLEDAHVVSKSYPGFYEELIKIGANIKLR